MNKSSIFTELLNPILVLTTICIITSGALALTNHLTAPIINAQLDEASTQSRKQALNSAEVFTQIPVDEVLLTEYSINSVYAGNDNTGFVFEAIASGYKPGIIVMIGFAPDASITGVTIVSQDETPGLGDRITSEDFLSQFAGKKGRFAIDNSADNKLDAISGATFSSKGVQTAVNNAVDLYKTLSESGVLNVEN